MLAVLLRSQMSRVFRCSHSDPHNRIEPRYFVPWIRYYLNLPRLIHGGEVRHIESANCAGELCSAQHIVKDGDSHVIGPTADHLASCPTAIGMHMYVGEAAGSHCQ